MSDTSWGILAAFALLVAIVWMVEGGPDSVRDEAECHERTLRIATTTVCLAYKTPMVCMVQPHDLLLFAQDTEYLKEHCHNE